MAAEADEGERFVPVIVNFGGVRSSAQVWRQSVK